MKKLFQPGWSILPEWEPTEKELIDELCSAREIDWPAVAKDYVKGKWERSSFSAYDDFMANLLKDGDDRAGRNFPEIPLRYMNSPVDWREKSLGFILEQTQKSPEEYQGYLKDAVDRYLTACLKRLDGNWPADPWDQADAQAHLSEEKIFSARVCYDFCCPDFVDDVELIKKIIVLQKLQELISELLTLGPSDTEPKAAAADLLPPLPEVKRAVLLHKTGSIWPNLVLDEIRNRLFMVAGSTDRAIDLFCEMYECPNYKKALSSAIKRKNQRKRK